jgi:hypothetical protein
MHHGDQQGNRSLAKKVCDLLGLPRAMSVAACVMDWARVLIQFYIKKFLFKIVVRNGEIKGNVQQRPNNIIP